MFFLVVRCHIGSFGEGLALAADRLSTWLFKETDLVFLNIVMFSPMEHRLYSKLSLILSVMPMSGIPSLK